ncbi:hypothetical protein BGZ94_006166 [Podila epigama]|nr:hypothetical protein BGZ94_006166 [Podila epigama]
MNTDGIAATSSDDKTRMTESTEVNTENDILTNSCDTYTSTLEEKAAYITFDASQFYQQSELDIDSQNKSLHDAEEEHVERVETSTHLVDQVPRCQELKLICSQFLEHRRPKSTSSPSMNTNNNIDIIHHEPEENKILCQIRSQLGPFPVEIRFLDSNSEEELPFTTFVHHGLVVHCLQALKNALSDVVLRFGSIEQEHDGTWVSMIYFDSNALPSINPHVPYTVLLSLRLDIIWSLDHFRVAGLFQDNSSSNLDSTKAITTQHASDESSHHSDMLQEQQQPQRQQQQQQLLDAIMTQLAQDILIPEYPLIFSLAKMNHFIWAHRWATVSAHSVYNIFCRATNQDQKEKMNSFIQMCWVIIIVDDSLIFVAVELQHGSHSSIQDDPDEQYAGMDNIDQDNQSFDEMEFTDEDDDDEVASIGYEQDERDVVEDMVDLWHGHEEDDVVDDWSDFDLED